MNTKYPPEYLPVRVLREGSKLSASIHERTGLYGRYYFAEIAHDVTTAEGDRVNARMTFMLDDLPELGALARRAYRVCRQLEAGPAQEPIDPEWLN